MKNLLVKDLMAGLNTAEHFTEQKSSEYIEWLNSDLVNISEEFAQKNGLIGSHFIKRMNNVFKTSRFELLLKRWLVEYFVKLFNLLNCAEKLILEDNPLNRFGIEKYHDRFKALPKIKLEEQTNFLQRILSILLRGCFILHISLNKGFRVLGKIKKYKVMREATWGLYDTGGYYFHDDFLVDGDKIKKEDILLFSRGVPIESGRLKGYHDARKSCYTHFDLLSLQMSAKVLFFRIVPKYIILISKALFAEIYSKHFSLYWSIYLYFINNALPYEKLFSNFEIVSELGHNYFSAGHIPEAIVCQNYGAKYYLMHWSDNSIDINKYGLSFLGCDGLLVWGKAHVRGIEGAQDICIPTGYVFKSFIKKVMTDKSRVLSEMGICCNGKIVSFFDESFGYDIKMTEENYVIFWETALKLAEIEKNVFVLVKPKELDKYNNLSGNLKQRFIKIKDQMGKTSNLHIVDANKWSFVEVIGVSDIVVTQGMTSSSTIAIICGIEGLYLDQVDYNHPFSRLFKDKIVFNDPDKLLVMIQKIIKGAEKPLENIPEDMLRNYDAYPDDRGIDLFRDILSGKAKKRKRVGIIVQARMGSTRLPGKIMKTILGRTMLEILIDRLKKCREADLLIIATTNNKNDDIVKKQAIDECVACFRGEEDDVLNRYYEAAKAYGVDVIVRITSDCPLMDPVLVDNLIDFYFINQPVGYVTNTIERTYPRGYDIEIFDFKSLETAERCADKPYQREHVTPYIFENMKKMNYRQRIDSSKYRVTVDTIEDFELVNRIFEYFKEDRYFGHKQVIDLLDSRQDLVEINQFVKQKTA